MCHSDSEYENLSKPIVYDQHEAFCGFAVTLAELCIVVGSYLWGSCEKIIIKRAVNKVIQTLS